MDIEVGDKDDSDSESDISDGGEGDNGGEGEGDSAQWTDKLTNVVEVQKLYMGVLYVQYICARVFASQNFINTSKFNSKSDNIHVKSVQKVTKSM